MPALDGPRPAFALAPRQRTHLTTLATAPSTSASLVAGATGTGKTKTLQLMAEQLSSAGVPVFAADIKGDLSGLATPGVGGEAVSARAASVGQQWRLEAGAATAEADNAARAEKARTSPLPAPRRARTHSTTRSTRRSPSGPEDLLGGVLSSGALQDVVRTATREIVRGMFRTGRR